MDRHWNKAEQTDFPGTVDSEVIQQHPYKEDTDKDC